MLNEWTRVLLNSQFYNNSVFSKNHKGENSDLSTNVQPPQSNYPTLMTSSNG